MRVDTFSYELPPERIAQRPADDREAARLMVLLGDGPRREVAVGELASLLPKGALVVLNDTRVLRARLLGKKPETGGKVEIFLVRKVGERSITIGPAEGPGSETRESREGLSREVEVWRALGKASKPLKFDTDVIVGATEAPPGPACPPGLQLVVRLLGRAEDDGLLEVGLTVRGGGSVEEAIRALGHVPLPPYIKRDDRAEDADRYQTVFARVDGAVAAPTAGLHVTRALLGRLAVRECEVATVTLHVGLGTFQPVSVEDLDQHAMHNERFEVTRTAARAIARARERGAPVVAIGTTVVRALESAADPERPGFVRPMAGDTRLLIQPGKPDAIKVVDILLTNFHLPRSTLLAMVCAFGGTERVLSAYRSAVEEGYRFYSYGDAMLLDRDRSSTNTSRPAASRTEE
jgi:S-adenosylmethionine:tRNA ribosyltransferase-isomerase